MLGTQNPHQMHPLPYSCRRALLAASFAIVAPALVAQDNQAPRAGLGKAATEALASSYATRDHWMQKVVLLLSLGASWHPAGTPMVVQAIRDKDPRLCAFGIETLLRSDPALLPKIATPDLLDELITRQLARTNAHLHERVLLALSRLAPAANAKDRAAWTAWWNGAKATFAPEPITTPEPENAGMQTSATAKRAFDLYQAGLDLLVCIDSTGSMQPTIDALADALAEMVDILDGISPKMRLAVVQYKDYGDLGKPGAKVVQPFTKDVRAARKELDDLRADGGGDLPEAVLGGLTVSFDPKMNWQPDANKLIVVIGDAPPHPEEAPKCIDLVRTMHDKPGAVPGKVVTGVKTEKPTPFLTSCIGVFVELKGKLREQPGYQEFVDSQKKMREDFGAIAKAGGGTFVEVQFTFTDEQPKEKPKDKAKAKEQQKHAGRAIASAATRRIVEHILVLSFGERFAPELGDFVRIFYEYKDAELIK